MPKDDDNTEASGLSAQGMTAEEINTALAAVLEESSTSDAPAAPEPAAPGAPEALAGPIDSPDDRSPSENDVATDTPSSTPEDGESAEPTSSPTDTAAENPPAPPSTPSTTAADTEAALDQIDADLAELESLLAQTSSDGTSIPESIAQAPPPPPPTDQPQGASAQDAAAKVDSDPAAEASGDEASQADIADDEPSELEADSTTASEDLLFDDMSGPAPKPPDETQAPPAEAGAAEAQPAAATAVEIAPEPVDDTLAGLFERLLTAIILTPLVALDMPFACLSSRTKNVLGLAGIATLLVALATWLVGNHR